MPRFKYRMENILELNLKLEEQQKTAFMLANAAFIQEQEKLKELMVRKSGYEAGLKASAQDAVDLKKINYYKKSIDIMKSLIRDQMFALKKAENALEEERSKLDEAIKDRKIQEKLKEKAFEDFKKEMAADESKAIDQLVSFTYKPVN